jgi:DNA-binding MarR family transcriptional regulator
MVDLAREQMITQAAMTSIVDHLRELGFVECVRNEADRRTVRVAITRQGEEQVKKGMRIYKKFIEKATSGLTSNEVSNFLRMLDRMLEAAQSDERGTERG